LEKTHSMGVYVRVVVSASRPNQTRRSRVVFSSLSLSFILWVSKSNGVVYRPFRVHLLLYNNNGETAEIVSCPTTWFT
jgi:hypothetical protein